MRESPCPALPVWPGTRDRIACRPRVEPSTTVKKIINEMIQYEPLYSQIDASSGHHHQRGFLRQQMGVGAKTHSYT